MRAASLAELANLESLGRRRFGVGALATGCALAVAPESAPYAEFRNDQALLETYGGRASAPVWKRRLSDCAPQRLRHSDRSVGTTADRRGRPDAGRTCGDVGRQFDLRGYDAVHCASAELINDDELVAVTGDRHLLTAWRGLGLTTYDTTQA